MTLKTLMAEHVQTVFLNTDHFASAGIVYSDSLIGAVTITAIVEEEKADDQPDGSNRTQRRTRLVTFSRNPLAASGGVADPKTSGKVTVGDRSYDIEAIERLDDDVATLRCLYVGRLPSNNRQIGR